MLILSQKSLYSFCRLIVNCLKQFAQIKGIKIMKFQARQGDIFFEQVSGPPKGKKLKKKDDPILAYGELTGHSHKVISPTMEEMEMIVDENGDIYAKSMTQEIRIGHDEHDLVIAPPNTWICITRQREYDYLAAEEDRIRRVQD